jgi:hypothetical protein
MLLFCRACRAMINRPNGIATRHEQLTAANPAKALQ